MSRSPSSRRCIRFRLIVLLTAVGLIAAAHSSSAATAAAATHGSNGMRASVRAVQPAIGGLFQIHTPRVWADVQDAEGLTGGNGVPDFLDSWEAFRANVAAAVLEKGYAFKSIDAQGHAVLYAGFDGVRAPGSLSFEFNEREPVPAQAGLPKSERSPGDLRVTIALDADGLVAGATFARYSTDAKGGKFQPILVLPGEGCSSDGAACVVANGATVEIGYNLTILDGADKDFAGIQISSGGFHMMAALTGVTAGCVKEIGGINPVCTANDVRLAGVKDVVILQGDQCDLNNPNDTITVQSFTGIFTSGPQRYDIGSYVATDGGGSDGARSGSCTRFAFQNNAHGLSNLDGDTCGDIGAGTTAEIPMGPITIKCSDGFRLVNGQIVAGGDNNIDFFHCETWAQNSGEINCTGSSSVKAGSPSKCGCGLIDAAAGFCVVQDDGNPCTDDVCRGTCQTAAGGGSGAVCASNAQCGAGETCRNISAQHVNKADGFVCGTDPDANNPCDVNQICQSGQCTTGLASAGTECRAAEGECDVAESCTGTSATCPTDGVKGNGVSCSSDDNVCTSDICNGTLKTCTHPAVADGPRAGCDAAGDQCNNGAQCVSGSCVASSPKADGTDCENATASGGACDAQDECESGLCVEKYASAQTSCRSAGGFCDVAENCTGSSAACPDDGFKDNTVECRASNGICDLAESCTGSSATCPDDGFKASTVECRASNGVCDLAESCTGSSATCPDDGFKASTVECRASNGVCDLAESCTGSSAACPDDVFKAATVECRAQEGVCDVAESCTGSAAACPQDAVRPDTFQCRGSDGSPCDPVEYCDGVGKNCGPDLCAGGVRPDVSKDLCE